MSRRHLTRKQHAFLEYLQSHLQERKVWPTYREIVDHFEYRSPNSVTQNLQALARKGFLRRDRDGYHLVQREGEAGSIPVRWTLDMGQFSPPTAPEHLSLASLFRDVSGVGALKLSADVARTAELGEAHYVFMSEGEVPEGEVAVVLHEGALALRTMEQEDPLDPATTILGRYAGHAGPYGIVRRSGKPQVETSEV
ncbi:MAG: hypothetical protein AAF170_04505 [Bacteroidota bacterium]